MATRGLPRAPDGISRAVGSDSHFPWPRADPGPSVSLMTRVLALLAVATGLVLGTPPLHAQVPARDVAVPALSPEWRDAYAATQRELTASIVDVEDHLNAARRGEAWAELDCGLARLAELRILRDLVDEAAAAIEAAQQAGRHDLARHHWLGLSTSRLHGEVIAQEATLCARPATDDRAGRVVVRVAEPTWDPDADFGAPPHAGSPARF